MKPKSALTGDLPRQREPLIRIKVFQFDCFTILILLAAGAAEAKFKETKRRRYQVLPRRRYRGS